MIIILSLLPTNHELRLAVWYTGHTVNVVEQGDIVAELDDHAHDPQHEHECQEREVGKHHLAKLPFVYHVTLALPVIPLVAQESSFLGEELCVELLIDVLHAMNGWLYKVAHDAVYHEELKDVVHQKQCQNIVQPVHT